MSELYHHGVVGMKWGVRRYQNEDGSLTDAGQKRYNKLQDNYQKNDKWISEYYRQVNKDPSRDNPRKFLKVYNKQSSAIRKLNKFEKNSIDLDAYVRYKHGKDAVEKYIADLKLTLKSMNDFGEEQRSKGEYDARKIDEMYYGRIAQDPKLREAHKYVDDFFNQHADDPLTWSWLITM